MILSLSGRRCLCASAFTLVLSLTSLLVAQAVPTSPPASTRTVTGAAGPINGAQQNPDFHPGPVEFPPNKPQAADPSAPSPTAQPSASSNSSPAGLASTLIITLARSTGSSPFLWDMLFTVALGAFGSSAYLFATLVGFIQPRDALLIHLTTRGDPITPEEFERTLRWGRAALFILFGAVVACVFQLPQSPSFAPIQAFVMGATWPTVVNRMLTGNTPSNPTDLLTRKSKTEEKLKPDNVAI